MHNQDQRLVATGTDVVADEGEVPRPGVERLLGLDRKQIARVLAHEGIKIPRSKPASSRLPEILELRRQGVSVTEIARHLGFGRSTIRRALQEAEDCQPN